MAFTRGALDRPAQPILHRYLRDHPPPHGLWYEDGAASRYITAGDAWNGGPVQEWLLGLVEAGMEAVQ